MNAEAKKFPEIKREINPNIEAQSLDFYNQALKDCLKRSSGSRESRTKVETALERRFLPHISEGLVISDAISSPDYDQGFRNEISNYLECYVGIGICPDGRIIFLAVADPRIAGGHRRLGGIHEAYEDPDSGIALLENPNLTAAIETYIELQIKQHKVPEFLELLGPHIFKTRPHNGCGYLGIAASNKGHSNEVGMRFGGIPLYFETMGDRFFAFDNTIRSKGGMSTTQDMVHDASSQGLIFGLKDSHRSFNPQKSLEENIKDLAGAEQILVTEFLDPVFSEQVMAEATKRGLNAYIDPTDFSKFGTNAMLIGRVAKEICQREEEDGFPFIPNVIRGGKTERALRAIAYQTIRNVTYRVLSNITPDNHALTEHPETLIRVGNTGPDFNIQYPSFIQNMPADTLRGSDIDGIARLIPILDHALVHRRAHLQNEGRIIFVTDGYEEEIYNDDATRSYEFNKVKSRVKINSDRIRERYKELIYSGEIIVVGGIFEPKSRRLIHIVTG